MKFANWKIYIFLVILIMVPLSQTFEEHLSGMYQEMKNTFNKYQKQDEPKPFIPYRTEVNVQKDVHQIYDFIIVGSGSAGSVLANRLSENPTWNILLLEAGKGENFFSQIPLFAPALQFTAYNWNYFAEPQPHMCTGLNRRQMAWPRGRALGGTTVINYMIYTRGNRLDYDRWALTCPTWSFRNVLPYFQKSERARLAFADRYAHGINGLLPVEDIYQSELVRTFIKAGKELNLTHFDYNANRRTFGVSAIQATVNRGRRASIATSYLKPIKATRPNLHILTSAYVTKVLIDPLTRTAFGVQYDRLGHSYEVHTSKEVILSAGAFNSPQLLMLAGIGPRDHLAELGIPLLVDLPVGRNLQDHLTFVGLTFLINQDLSLSPRRVLESIGGYFENGTGPLTSLGGVEGIGYIKTDQSRDPLPVQDIELLYIGGSLATDYGLISRITTMNIRDDVYDALFRSVHNLPQWTIFPMLLHPKSVGFLKLRSSNPYDYPLFYGNYFTDRDQQDINTFVASIRFIQKLANTGPFRRLGSQLNTNRVIGCEAFVFDSDAYWRCALRALAVTLHHQVGTAKMGPKGDASAVVDEELRVHGIRGLRVADCSVIPFALSAHTNAPAVMVGEKAADIIKAAWGG